MCVSVCVCMCVSKLRGIINWVFKNGGFLDVRVVVIFINDDFFQMLFWVLHHFSLISFRCLGLRNSLLMLIMSMGFLISVLSFSLEFCVIGFSFTGFKCLKLRLCKSKREEEVEELPADIAMPRGNMAMESMRKIAGAGSRVSVECGAITMYEAKK